MQVKMLEVSQTAGARDAKLAKIKDLFGAPYFRHIKGDSCRCCWKGKKKDGKLEFVQLEIGTDSGAIVKPLVCCE